MHFVHSDSLRPGARARRRETRSRIELFFSFFFFFFFLCFFLFLILLAPLSPSCFPFLSILFSSIFE